MVVRMVGVAAGTVGLIALAAGAAPSRGPAPLCAAGETALFACAIGVRRVAVCGRAGGAVYRFGRAGRIELTSADLTMATRGYAGGGETQITAWRAGHGYTMFNRTTRTGFGADGRHDAADVSGLVVHRGGSILSTRLCRGDAPIAAAAARIIPAGPIVPH